MRWLLFPLFFLLISSFCFLIPNKSYAAISVVHNFAGNPTDGANPCDLAECSLLLDNGVFYGMTEEGGSNNFGIIFKMNVDGSGYTILHNFAGGTTDGSSPRGSLIKSGSVLYGTAASGGVDDWGIVFKINTDGTGFSILHSFDLANGSTPTSSVVLSGGVLYGSTSGGGASQDGTIYKVNTDGTGFSVIHELDGDTEGTTPGGIIIDTSIIYGMTSAGGTSNKGTIYKIGTNGSGMTVLRQFSGLLTNGALPYGSLLMYQSKLYGMTNEGGANNLGTIFRINTDGTGFSILRSFSGGTTQGQWPGGSLIENNGVFYGMTYYGGDNDYGTVFQMNADGSSFSTLHEFLGGTSDGQYSNGNVIFNTENSRLYGMTVYGGTTDNGIIFYYQTAVPTPSPTPTPTPTNAPTPTPTESGSNSSSSSNSSNSSSNVCSSQAPSSTPDLFQINTTNTTATLYFSPAGNPNTYYYVSYGNGNYDQGYGGSFSQGQTGGVISYTISDLSPNTTYTFKIRGGNNCMSGGWSRDLTAKTTSSKNKKSIYYPISFIPYTIKYTIPKTVEKVKNVIPFVKNSPIEKSKQVTGVKKVIPEKAVPKNNQSIIKKIINLF